MESRPKPRRPNSCYSGVSDGGSGRKDADTYQAGGSETERRGRDAVEATVLAPGRAGVYVCAH